MLNVSEDHPDVCLRQRDAYTCVYAYTYTCKNITGCPNWTVFGVNMVETTYLDYPTS